MNYKHIHYFVVLAEARSFVRAATRLNITQPALSNRIKELETAAGALLFERRGRGVVLTELGEELLSHATEAVAAVETATASLRSLRARSRFARIGVTPTLGVLLTPGLVSASGEESLQLRIYPGSGPELFALLNEDSIDAALCFEAPRSSRLLDTPLFELDYYLVGPVGRDRSAGEFIKFKELSGFPLVLDGQENPARRLILGAEKEASLALDVRAEVGPANAKRVTMVSNKFSTIAPRPLFLDDIEAGRFQARLIVEPKITVTARLVTHIERQKRLRNLTSLLLAVADQAKSAMFLADPKVDS